MIIICDEIRKNTILNNDTNEFLRNVKYMTKRDFIHNFYFEYDKETIYEVMKKYNCNSDIAKIYLDNIYYVEDRNYNNSKLDKLVEIKKYLKDNNFIKENLLFKEFIKSKKIIFDNLELNSFDMKMIEILKKITEVEIINKEYNNYSHFVYEFNTIDEEVEYVASSICKLLDSGIDISKIKITGINSDYDNSIKRIFNMYNLKIREEINLYGTDTVKYFIKNYSSDLNTLIENMKINKYDMEVIEKIIDICNDYNFISDYNLVKELIIKDLSKLKITKHYDNEIEIIDLYNNNITDEYVFLLNYNQESIPKIYFDKDYITDDIKPLVSLDTVDVLNKKERVKTINAINNIKNLTITYKLKTPFASFSYANIIDMEVRKVELKNVNYSTISNKINLTKMLDNLIKYKTKDKLLDTYYKHFKIDYKTYDNKYKKIKETDLKEYLNNKLNLSYTSMNDYYKCGFKYYLKYILKVDKNTDEFKRHIGSIFHYVLEKGLNSDIDINDTVLNYLKDNEINLNAKDSFFLNSLIKELPIIIDVIKKQDNYIKLDNRLYEEEIKLSFNDKLDVSFKGIIDKIMYKDNVYALIDYKTGSSDINLSLNYYGINMQLAIYLYLASKRFKNAKFAGFYLQYILSSSLKDDLETKENNLKLCGYSNKNLIDKFDKTYQSSSLIKSLRVKNDLEFSATSKVLSDKEIKNLIELASEKVKDSINGITGCDFDINPKQINGKNVSCEYCIYKDICFMNNKDIVNLETKDLSFLGGDVDA